MEINDENTIPQFLALTPQFAHSSWVRILNGLYTKKRLRDLEPFFRLRADDGIRTHDINLGKVALYH